MDYATLGKAPISENSPCGADARYEPEFEAVQNEIDKLSSPSASSGVDWSLVVENAAAVLQSKSKDLTVACYLSVALVVTRQVDGLDQGVTLLREMMGAYWDDLFPVKRRMRGRVAAVQWWLERVENELQKIQPAALTQEQVQRINRELEAMDEFLSQNMPDAPVLRPLQRIVAAWPLQSPQSAVEEPPAAKQVDAPSTVPSAQETVPVAALPPETPPAARKAVQPAAADSVVPDEAMTEAIGSEVEARRAADAAFQRLRQVSAFLLQKNLKDPLAYRYRRAAAWSKVTMLPANIDGNTQITSPPPQVIRSLENLRGENKSEALIQSAEPKLSQYIFWFDLNRFIAEALNELGAACGKALSVVCQETAALVQRLPDLPLLRFADGTPFADDRTRQWLKSINEATGSAAVTPGKETAPAQMDAFNNIIQKARAMADRKNLVDAVETLQLEMQRSRAHHLKMRWRLAIARLLLDEKKPHLAVPHLEQIVADIDTFQLETWAPELAVEGLSAAWQGFGAQPASDHKTWADNLLRRIARLDPAAALRLSP